MNLREIEGTSVKNIKEKKRHDKMNNETKNETNNETNNKPESKGRVSSIHKNNIMVLSDGREYQSKLKGSFYLEDAYFPLVGDYVNFYKNEHGDSVINSICERKNYMSRPDQSGHAIGFVKNMVEQGMIANFDYVFIVTALNKDYSFNRVARYVSIALQSEAVPVVVLTKSDLCSNAGRYLREIEELSDKVKVHTVSALYGIGIDELAQYFENGKTIALLGSSGAGKSTLVNAISGKNVMKTSEIRESDSKGRHTTTYRQLFVLDNGTTIIDTPGMREIGMQNVGDGLDDTFEDIIELGNMCRFSDCKHKTEPGCAIKAALSDGRLSEKRYKLYLGLTQENKSNSEKMKQIAIWKKQKNNQNAN